jgi:predicted HTH transcriptional regulator
VTEQEFEAILGLGHEINGVEFKGPGIRSDKPFFARVVRAVLGMANRRDGGLVIIGVEENNIGEYKLEPVGLTDEQLATWSNYDVLSGAVNQYARPSVSFDLEAPFLYNSMRFVVIEVNEFDQIPILCSKDSGTRISTDQILRKGACYVRSRHKPETSEIPSEEEMRELLELATDKGVMRFFARAEKAGLYRSIQSPPASPSDKELFRDQIKDMG